MDEFEAAVRESIRELVGVAQGSLSGAELEGAGWLDLLEEDAPLAISALLDELGRSAMPSDALDLVALRLVTSGLERPIAVVHPMPGRPVPAGTVRDGTVDAEGIVLAGADTGGRLVVTAQTADGLRVVVVRAGYHTVTPVEGIDPESRYRRVSITAAPVEADVSDQDVFKSIVRRGLALELIGISSRMLEVAIEHVSSRVQFGRPLGSNQAVRHRLADVHTAIEAARAVVDYSWMAKPDEAVIVGALAKSLASAAFDEASRHCLQVCGGMGFTTEFPLGRLVRRGSVLAALYGDAASIAPEVGHDLVSGGAIPRLSGFDKGAAA